MTGLDMSLVGASKIAKVFTWRKVAPHPPNHSQLCDFSYERLAAIHMHKNFPRPGWLGKEGDPPNINRPLDRTALERSLKLLIDVNF